MDADDLLRHLGDDYWLLLAALGGRYAEAIAPGQTVTPAALHSLKADAERMTEAFLEGLTARVTEWSTRLAPEAHAGAFEAFPTFIATVRGFLRENVATVVKSLRESRSDLGKIMKGAHGAIGKLLQRRITAPTFVLLDTAGRRWDALKLFKFTLRDYLYQTTIQATVDSLIAEGETHAESYYPAAPGRPGETFALADFSKIRARVFHPNATAQVRKHVYPE